MKRSTVAALPVLIDALARPAATRRAYSSVSFCAATTFL